MYICDYILYIIFIYTYIIYRCIDMIHYDPPCLDAIFLAQGAAHRHLPAGEPRLSSRGLVWRSQDPNGIGIFFLIFFCI